MNNLTPHPVKNLGKSQSSGLTIQTLDIKEFITNKNDVDFEDIIAGHPYVGKRSPRPHNDAQVYFSNTDPRYKTI